MKIESRINDLVEARNFMNNKDQSSALSFTAVTVEQFEKKLTKERMDKIVKEKQNEQKAQKELQAKMEKKFERMANLKDFRG